MEVAKVRSEKSRSGGDVEDTKTGLERHAREEPGTTRW